MNLYLLCSLSFAVVATAYAPPAGAQPAFESAATLFGEGVFSTGLYELTPSFTPDRRTAYFTVSTPAYGRLHVVMETHLRDGQWTAPEVAPFSGQYADADPVVSPDGQRLFFISKRPIALGDAPRDDFDIFVMDREGEGWGPARHISAASGPGAEHYASAAADGTLYIAAVRPDSHGRGDLYRVPFAGGAYGEPENLGPAINSPDHHDTTPFVDPEQRYIIFSSWGRADGAGRGGDLYVSFRQHDGTWGEAHNLGPRVNSPATEYCPVVSQDGRYLYFTSDRGFADEPLERPLETGEWARLLDSPGNGLGDVYSIELEEAFEAAAELP